MFVLTLKSIVWDMVNKTSGNRLSFFLLFLFLKVHLCSGTDKCMCLNVSFQNLNIKMYFQGAERKPLAHHKVQLEK